MKQRAVLARSSLCSPGSMFPRFYVPHFPPKRLGLGTQVLCSPLSGQGSVYRDRTYVPQVLCSPGTKKVVRNTTNSTKSSHITGIASFVM